VENPTEQEKEEAFKVAQASAEKICETIMNMIYHFQADYKLGGYIAGQYMSEIAGYVLASMLSNAEGTKRNGYLIGVLETAFEKESKIREYYTKGAN